MSSIEQPGGSHHADGMSSDQPMLNQSLLTGATAMSQSSYSTKMQLLTRKNRCRWILFLVVAILTLAFLVVGAVALILMSDNEHVPTSQKRYSSDDDLTAGLPQQLRTEELKSGPELIFEYVGEKKKKEKVIIDLKNNSTELFSEEVDVINHFKKRISVHRLEVSPGIEICLVKTIEAEVRPGELADALKQAVSIQVNSTEIYIIDPAPVSVDILNDMTVTAYCPTAKIFSLRKINESSSTVGITMEELISSVQGERRYKRQSEFARSNPLDNHNAESYHCGGPIGEPTPPLPYKCTKQENFCYKNLVNEKCMECYHGHYLRTRGCWCPITAIHTCIKISWKPVNRMCCGVNEPPCIRNECDEHWRVPYIPVPVITFSITETEDLLS